MSVRKISAKLGLAAVAVSGLALTALAPANADTVPGHDSVPGTYTLGTTVIGVGSDTLQWVDDKLSADYDATTPAVAWANFDACLGNTSAGAPGLGDNPDGSGFPCGADHTGTKAGVKRDEGVVDPAAAGGALPSGSGDGRTLLRTPTDKLFMDVAYGRSSGPINTTDLAAGEIALPFAVDKIVVSTHPGGPGSGVADRSADPQDLQRHLHQLEPGRRQERHDPPLHAEGRLEHPERVPVLPGSARRRQRGPGHRQRPDLALGRVTDLAGPARRTGDHGRQLEHRVATAVPPTAANVEEHDPSVDHQGRQRDRALLLRAGPAGQRRLADRADRGRLVRGPRALPRRARAEHRRRSDDAVRLRQ